MRRPAPLVLIIALIAPSVAHGQLRLLEEDERLISKTPPNISTDLMDPTGNTRLHITTRGTFSIPDDVFSDNSVWTFNLQAFLRIKKGWAVHASLPFGLFAPSAGTNEFVFGNFRVGTAFGFDFRLQPQKRDVRSARLRIGGGLDVYAPTTAQPDAGTNLIGDAIIASLRNVHSFEPELFISDAMFFRFRAHAQVSFSILTIETELGLSPGFTTVADSDALMLVSWGARISAKPTYLFDPYLEAASSFHVAGKADPDFLAGNLGRNYTTPVWITPGVRFHFGPVDPAFFVSLNADEFAVLFGIDLAGAAREWVRPRDDDSFLESVPTRQL